MKIENYRYIKSLQLPNGWVESKSPGNAAGTQIIRSFFPPRNVAVKIELLHWGLPVSENASRAFREILKSAPKLIFNHESNDKPIAATIQLIQSLEEILGNAGNNQIVNTETGLDGPSFMLERLETLIWNTKPLLAARGWFRNPEDDERITEFCGFFIDTNSSDTTCSIEEIYLETPSQDLALQYLPAFKECLSSIEWLST